jgi:hypothetical protein
VVAGVVGGGGEGVGGGRGVGGGGGEFVGLRVEEGDYVAGWGQGVALVAVGG